MWIPITSVKEQINYSSRKYHTVWLSVTPGGFVCFNDRLFIYKIIELLIILLITRNKVNSIIFRIKSSIFCLEK